MYSDALPDLKLSFDTVFYYVNDMNRSISFYGETLGLPMLSPNFVARFDINGVLFELVPTRTNRQFQEQETRDGVSIEQPASWPLGGKQ